MESIRREKETIRRETEAIKADLEEKKRELERLQYGTDLEWRQWETVDMPMSPLLQGPEQSAPTTVALAAESPAAEVTTDTRVFPDTAAPDTSVERAATKLTAEDGPSSKINGERTASTGTLVPLAVRYNNNNNSSSNNDTTTTCVVALLRPFDPGKRCQRDARIGAVLGLDLPFDRGKTRRRAQHGGLMVSSRFYLVCIKNTGETRNCVSARENSARENNSRNAC